MKLASLDDLYVDELKNLYHAEHQLLKTIPDMEKAALHSKLAKAFGDHLAQTGSHVDRLEKIFQRLNTNPSGKSL